MVLEWFWVVLGVSGRSGVSLGWFLVVLRVSVFWVVLGWFWNGSRWSGWFMWFWDGSGVVLGLFCVILSWFWCGFGCFWVVLEWS
jgi:hypothetical protein